MPLSSRLPTLLLLIAMVIGGWQVHGWGHATPHLAGVSSGDYIAAPHTDDPSLLPDRAGAVVAFKVDDTAGPDPLAPSAPGLAQAIAQPGKRPLPLLSTPLDPQPRGAFAPRAPPLA